VTHRPLSASTDSGRLRPTVEAMTPRTAAARQSAPAPIDTAPAALSVVQPQLTDPTPHVTAVSVGLTPADVAELVRVDVYTVRRWVNAGALPAYRIGRRLLIDPAQLDLFLQTRLVRS
jgi:excisionase family DNA binding protein